jgi:hypothetical protein
MSYLREFRSANMQDFLYGTELETPYLFVEVGRSILKCQSQLTHKDREMMAAYCLSLNNAHQPINVHTRNFALLGGESWIIQDLVRDTNYICVQEKYRPLLAVIRKSTENPSSVNKQDIEACYESGWNGHTVHLVATLSGFFNQMARWVNILGMPYSQEEVIGSSDYLVNSGYGPNDDSPGLNDADYKSRFPDYLETTFVMKEQDRVEMDV